MKPFINQMLDPDGKISAPQTMGAILLVFGVIMSIAALWLPSAKDLLVTIFATAAGLLGVGSAEVYGRSKYGSH